ncbi:MAG TPA: hypothetical protein PK228_01470 [Saprospiraceae bacterium]|nr:hypothetical protein [Saprospiraceae bacterium]
MRYLISTSAKNGAAEYEATLRRLGSIATHEHVKAYPSPTVRGAYDLYLIDATTDLAARTPAKPKAKPKTATKQPVQRHWLDNANIVTAIIVALLIGIIFRSLSSA